MGKTKYIFSSGELKRQDNSLNFRSGGKNNYIPIEQISEIYCFGEVTLNSRLLDFLASNGVLLHFFNYFGNYSGTYYPREGMISGRLLVRQVNASEFDRLKVAKPIVRGIAENIDEVLYHYYKHEKREVKEVIDWIRREVPGKIDRASQIKELLQIEGEIWMRFYSTFKYFLPEDFVMNKRVKRPPDNPINAMISFGNSLLYSKTISVIYETHLNQTVSFLHEPSEGRFSLSLDMCEVFKPIIVFRTIFNLVNLKKIQVNKHFEKNLNYCMLNEEGRKVFLNEFNSRLDSVFENKQLKRKTSYRYAMKLDCYKLIKFLLEDKPFVPFSLKEMK